MAVDIAGVESLAPGKPRRLFAVPDNQIWGLGRCIDVSPDGQRFLLHVRSGKAESVSRMDVIVNWTSTLPM
jgi:hypothetical protein